MKKLKILKVFICISIGLAVCVVGLLIASISSTTVHAEETAAEKASTSARAVSNEQNSTTKVSEETQMSEDTNSYVEEDTWYDDYYMEETEWYEEDPGYLEETDYIEETEAQPEEEYYVEETENWYEEEYNTEEAENWYEEEYYETTTEYYYEETTEEYYYEETTEYYEETTEYYYEEPETESPQASDTALAAAAIAEAHVGVTPYVPACHTLEGADCSGFTYACYAAAGYYGLGFSDSTQACQGRSVLNEEWLPGDIIVYYGHVAMYVGNGMMVHCPDVGRYAEYGDARYTTVLDVRRILE